ncbi:hypothetical protein GQ42DRAFT_160125 [Ramicandelaber brevisporus]|nr:hypothetical protein GQ42DRAFT_160125 [Ramicandelaber brevisporus]
MSDIISFQLEGMLLELQDLVEQGLFTEPEIRAIAKRRTKFEYAVKRRGADSKNGESLTSTKADFLRYIEYEMNIESLRVKRKKRLGKGNGKRGDNKGRLTLSEIAGIRRITALFERTLIKFPGDVSLWKQYADFAQRSHQMKLLGRIFGRAIQAHPRVGELWTLAASHEYGENVNTEAARRLFQRGLRLNKDDKQLWINYFKMEVAFVEKLKARRQVLGIGNNNEAEGENENAKENEMSEDIINVPTLNEEVEEDRKFGGLDKAVGDQFGESVASILDTGVEVNGGAKQLTLLDGAIPIIVATEAFKAIPGELDFHKAMIAAYLAQTADSAQVAMSSHIVNHILDSIENEFGAADASAVLYVVENRTVAHVSKEDPQFVDKMQAAIAQLDALCKAAQASHAHAPSLYTGLVHEYCDFLVRCFRLIDEENLRTFITKKLRKLLEPALTKNAEESKWLESRTYTLWLEWAASASSNESVLQIIESAIVSNKKSKSKGKSKSENTPTLAAILDSDAVEATRQYPSSSEDLWLMRISLAEDQQQNDTLLDTMKSAIAACPQSTVLHQVYIKQAISAWSETPNSKSATRKLRQVFDDLIKSTMITADSSSKLSRDATSTVRSTVLIEYAKWAMSFGGITEVRSNWSNIFKSSYPTTDYVLACIALELAHMEQATAAVNESESKRNLLILFDRLVSIDSGNLALWGEYLNWLVSTNQTDAASQVLWRARKVIGNTAAVDRVYASALDGTFVSNITSVLVTDSDEEDDDEEDDDDDIEMASSSDDEDDEDNEDDEDDEDEEEEE